MRFSLKIFGLLLVSGLLITSIGGQSFARDELSPIVPSIASFILPGSGQLINDQPNKAITHFLIGAVIYSGYTVTYFSGSYYTYYNLLPVLNLAWSGYSAYDAYQVASNKKQSIFNTSWNLNSAETAEPDFELADSSAGISELNREFSVSAVG